MANRPIPTPLPGDLPENWAAGQTVAPTGPEAGLSVQYGYNYQSKQINDAQKGVNKLNEAFDGLVPETRKVNSKALSSDISLSAADVGARPSTWTPSASDVGADPAGSASVVQANLNTHANDAVKHITSTERATWNGKEAALSGATTKTTLVDADAVVVTDSEASNATKRITWANVIAAIKSALNSVYALAGHTHGSLTNDGKIGSVADLPVFTGTGGALATKTAAEARAALGVAVPATSVTGTLTVAGWTGTGPYTQALAVTGLGAAQNGDIGLTSSATAEQREAARNAMLSVTAQAAGTLTITADGDKPTVAIPVVVMLLG